MSGESSPNEGARQMARDTPERPYWTDFDMLITREPRTLAKYSKGKVCLVSGGEYDRAVDIPLRAVITAGSCGQA